MKIFAAATLLFVNFAANASWNEKVECTVSRVSVDTQKVTMEFVTTSMTLSGPHNGESGSVEIESQLTPSYTIKLERFSGGRNENIRLTTRLQNEIMATASGDPSITKQIANRFITANGDYEITVKCATTF